MKTKQQFKNSMLTRTKVRNNILKVWNEATEADKFDWYGNANDVARTLGSQFGLRSDVVCGVIAALSPMTQWDQNKKLAEKACNLFTSGRDWSEMPCLKANAKKAWQIMNINVDIDRDAAILDILKGDKVSAFYLNIRYPADGICVTIDRHALSIALGRWINNDGYRTMTALQYEFFQECYRWTAAQLGINPLILQSATWVVWRRIKHNYK